MRIFLKVTMLLQIICFTQIARSDFSLKRISNGTFFVSSGDRVIDAQFFTVPLNGKQYVAVMGESGDVNSLLIYEFLLDGQVLQLVNIDLEIRDITGDPPSTVAGNDAYSMTFFMIDDYLGNPVGPGEMVIQVRGGEDGDPFISTFTYDGSVLDRISEGGGTIGAFKGIAIISNGFKTIEATIEQGINDRVVVQNPDHAPFVTLPLEAESFLDGRDIKWIVAQNTGKRFLLYGSGDVTAGSNTFFRVYEETAGFNAAPSMTLRDDLSGGFRALSTIRPFAFDGRDFFSIGYIPSSTVPHDVAFELNQTTGVITTLKSSTDKVVASTFVEHFGQAFFVEQISAVGNPLRIYSFDSDLDTFTLTDTISTPTLFTTLSSATINGEGYVIAGGVASSPGLVLYQVISAPTAQDDDYNVCTDAENVFLHVLANDIPGSNLNVNVTSVTAPTVGSAVILASMGILYDTPGGGFTGGDTFDYTIEDGNGNQDTATVTITIADDAGPTAIDDEFDICLGSSENYLYVVANDLAGCNSDLEITLFSQGSEGVVTQVNQTVLNYAHTGTLSGTDTFTYTIEDGNGQADTATVTLQIS